MSYVQTLTAAELLHTLRLTGARVRSYDNWQQVGRQVRRGAKIRSFYVEHGGKTWCVGGFGEDQLYPEGYRFVVRQPDATAPF